MRVLGTGVQEEPAARFVRLHAARVSERRGAAQCGGACTCEGVGPVTRKAAGARALQPHARPAVLSRAGDGDWAWGKLCGWQHCASCPGRRARCGAACCVLQQQPLPLPPRQPCGGGGTVWRAVCLTVRALALLLAAGSAAGSRGVCGLACCGAACGVAGLVCGSGVCGCVSRWPAVAVAAQLLLHRCRRPAGGCVV